MFIVRCCILWVVFGKDVVLSSVNTAPIQKFRIAYNVMMPFSDLVLAMINLFPFLSFLLTFFLSSKVCLVRFRPTLVVFTSCLLLPVIDKGPGTRTIAMFNSANNKAVTCKL